MRKTFGELSFEPIARGDIKELTAIMQRAFDADSMLHLGRPGGPPGYDNGEFLNRWAFDSHATSYKICRNDKTIGAIILWINKETKENYLGTIFIDDDLENKGIGTEVWAFVESEYHDTVVWRTETPIFSHRNHHFYINKLGFHVIKIDNPRAWDSGDGQFILEKQMR